MELVLEQLATHIPDLVIEKPLSDHLPQTIHSYGVVVFADISGFTDLCEKYTSGIKSKVDATDQLTTTLNNYLSKIVQAILEAGGDVLKFAGDALLAFWSCSRFSVSGMLDHVLLTCLNIQKEFGNFKTEDGDILRMKIGLSLGKVELHYIGNKSLRLFDVTGQAIEDSNIAQSHTRSGGVVISKAAWEYIDRQKCAAKLVGPGFAQISEFKTENDIILWASETNLQLVDKSASAKKTTQEIPSSRSSKFSKMLRLRRNSNNKEKKDAPSKCPKSTRTGLNLRYKIKESLAQLSQEAQQELRTYIIPTVLHKIDQGHDVSWFSELREVSVLFINLNPGSHLNASETLKLLQNSFDRVYPSLVKYHGSLNKVFMFDKGCTFLCIFGLPHTRHEYSACSCLRAARDIFIALGDMNLEGHYSIGVTTGMAFCGVVGHPQRHEYTVIGQKVNMAARLMMKFLNCITCDEVTKTKSALSSGQFKLAPVTKLKGIPNPDKIYEFSVEHIETKDLGWDIRMATDADDLIGRQKEMRVFVEELMHVSEHSRRDIGVIIITGSGGIGKTKLLRAMKAKAATMNFRVVSGIGGLIEQNTPFFTVKTLVTKLLQIDTCKNMHEREQLLLHHISDPEMRELLPLLNDLLVLKLPRTETTAELQQTEERTKALHKLLYRIVHQEALMKPCVFGIDDAHWIDPDSWLFLLDLVREPNAILIFTMRPLESIMKKPPALIEILEHPNTKVLKLEGLAPEHMVELTCRLLEVETIPDQLKNIIHIKSHGVPLWCEELVETMLELEYLKIEDDDECSDTVNEEMRKRGKSVFMHKFRQRSGSTDSASGGTIGAADIPIPDSVTGMVLARIDHMSASDQMTLKCASIIGTLFTRTMLQAIIPNCNTVAFHNSLNTLAEAGIIECAIAAKRKAIMSESMAEDTLENAASKLICSCLEEEQVLTASHKHHHALYPPVKECENLEFVHKYIQETAYNLCTEAQRKSLHEEAAHFLENQAHKCKNCGGGDFIGGRNSSVAKKKKNITRKAYHGVSRLQARDRANSMAPAGVVIEEETTAQTGAAVAGDDGTRKSSEETSSSDNTKETTSTRPSLKVSASNVMLDIDMQECHCDEVLAKVYPQLVRHWRAAGDLHNTMIYLIEEASAALATFNNMEALSLLQEAKGIAAEIGDNVVTKQELGRLQSLMGQTLYQMGQVEESMQHFHQALRLLHSKLPRSIVRGSIALCYHSVKHYWRLKFPSISSPMQLDKNEPFLERARCLAHISHAYRIQNRSIMGFMTALKRLNEAVQAQEYHVHEVMEAYAGMIEHCQQHSYSKLANHYFDRALAYCVGIDFSVEDIHAYAHLLFVGLSLQLYQGNLSEALAIGTASYNAIKKKHDASMEFCTLPLLFFTNMACFNRSVSGDLLMELLDVTSEADDLRAQALYDCCHFDALLEFGIDWQSENTTVNKAEACCTERDVYYFDEEERFFLVSCLALWHARKGNYTFAEKYCTIARDLQPKVLRTFLAAKAHCRCTEVLLLLMKKLLTRETILDVKKAMRKMKKALISFGVFEARYLHFKAYYHLMMNHPHKAQHLLNKAFIEANRSGCLYDAEWCLQSKTSWFPDATFMNMEKMNEDNEDTIFMYRFQK